MDLVYLIGTILSSVAAIFAWIAKIKWGNEYREATQQIITSKEAEIELLKSHIRKLEKFSPMVVEEYYAANMSQMESILLSVQEQLEIANNELSEHKEEIEELKSQEESYQDEITQKSELIKTKEERIKKLQNDYEDLKTLAESQTTDYEQKPMVDFKFDKEKLFRRISASSTDLGEVMFHDGSSELVSKLTEFPEFDPNAFRDEDGSDLSDIFGSDDVQNDEEK